MSGHLSLLITCVPKNCPCIRKICGLFLSPQRAFGAANTSEICAVKRCRLEGCKYTKIFRIQSSAGPAVKIQLITKLFEPLRGHLVPRFAEKICCSSIKKTFWFRVTGVCLHCKQFFVPASSMVCALTEKKLIF